MHVSDEVSNDSQKFGQEEICVGLHSTRWSQSVIDSAQEDKILSFCMDSSISEYSGLTSMPGGATTNALCCASSCSLLHFYVSVVCVCGGGRSAHFFPAAYGAPVFCLRT